MCGIWDWQSTIVKDLNDSQDPKHTLFRRENAFVAIYTLFSDKKCPLFTVFLIGRLPLQEMIKLLILSSVLSIILQQLHFNQTN